MSTYLPYALRKIWLHPANGSLAARFKRTTAWLSYQVQKQSGLFPANGRVISWWDDLHLHLLSNSQISQACLYYGLPDWPSMHFLRRYLRTGDLCADIGANVGLYTLLMARHAGYAGVHAFECLPSNVAKLRANLQLNGFDGPNGVVVHDVALADDDQFFELHPRDNDCTTSISPLSTNADADELMIHRVQARRLDGFTWPARFAYIKIDVEGAEQLVLTGSEQLLRHRPPLVWSFEYLDTQQRLGSTKVELLKAFAGWGYSFFLYRPIRNQLVPFMLDSDGWTPPREDDNVLAIHTSAVDLVARRLCGLT